MPGINICCCQAASPFGPWLLVGERATLVSAGQPFWVSLEMQGATLSIVLQVQSLEHRLSADAPHHLLDCPSAPGALEVILLHHHCPITSFMALEERNIQAADRWLPTRGLNVSGTEPYRRNNLSPHPSLEGYRKDV